MTSARGVDLGKLAPEHLRKLLACIKGSPEILVPPKPGFDCGVHHIDDARCLVISTDPCINVPIQHFGWLLFHYTASDLSVFGASPQYCAVQLLSHPGTHQDILRKVMRQFCEAADELGTIIVTGHTGTYKGLDGLLGVCTAYGIINRTDLITPAGAKPNDLILCTKSIGLETLTNLALENRRLADRLFGKTSARRLSGLVRMQSCVEEATILSKARGTSAMHDATEGGIVACMNEIADASNVGFVVDFSSIPIPYELNLLSKHFRLTRTQTLSISSTGTLLVAISKENENRILHTLKQKGLDARVIGVFTQDKKRVMIVDRQERKFPTVSDDPYARITSSSLEGTIQRT